MLKILLCFLQVIALFALPLCNKKATAVSTMVATTPEPIAENFFAKGADISWVTEMEANGIRFYDSSGVQTECMQLLKSLGMNAIRLRVWVNPANGWCNITDVLSKAKRAHALGLKLLIDFHYSDVWADPGHQEKPVAWQGYNVTQLTAAVTEHTRQVLDTLKSHQLVATWVQIGNETNNGMLWPEGKASLNMAAFADLINAGYNAVKAVSPSTKVIVHVSNGHDNTLFRWMFDGLRNNNARWDIIGMSLYPDSANWSSRVAECHANMLDMISRYTTPVMICEVGMSWDQPAASKAFLTEIIQRTREISGHNGLGVFYWEPEAHNNWNGYTLGAFDNTGRPTEALSAFN